MTVYLVLSRSYQEGIDVARALSLRPAIWPSEPWHVTTLDAEHIVLLRVEGWEQSTQTAEVVTLAEQAASCEMTMPPLYQLRHGPERAARAADSLARIREAKRSGSPFLDPADAARETAEELGWAVDFGRWIAHNFHLCPTRQAGLPCTVPPGTCRWLS